VAIIKQCNEFGVFSPERKSIPQEKKNERRRRMGKSRISGLIAMVISVFVATGAFAQMGGGMGGGGDMDDGRHGGGMGHGMHDSGDMVPGMWKNTFSHGYLDILNPITSADEARAAIEDFISASNSGLQISELWEYETVYKAELSDANGEKAFDLLADKFTGAVGPEMGLSMMRNASYGKGLYKVPVFRKNLTITADQATTYAQNFVDANGLGYVLGSPEIYPGYYKFHTTVSGGLGMDILVNGYNGKIWMNTILGVPLAEY
jgi:hypothetical protein